jgi:hypothetical protein
MSADERVINNDLNFHLLSVSSDGKRPALFIFAGWLPDIGFSPGALVSALPGPDGGIIFTLCDENIKSYSRLDTETKGRGGKLIQAYYAQREKNGGPALSISGEFIKRAGLNTGDALIARYGPGVIRVRKRPDSIKVLRVSGIKGPYSDKQAPKIETYGDWLHKFGFEANTLMTVASAPGALTFEAADDGLEKYSDLVRFARQNKLKLIQVGERAYRKKKGPYIGVSGSCLSDAGFAIGDTLLAFFGQGRIQLQKFDPAKAGF